MKIPIQMICENRLNTYIHQEQLPPNKAKTAKSQPHIGLTRLSIP